MIDQKDLDKLTWIMDRKNTIHIDLLKHILVTASTILAGLVAFYHKIDHPVTMLRLVYPASLSLIAAGILFCSIGLFGVLSGLRTLQKLYAEQLSKSARDGTRPAPVVVNDKPIFVFFERAGYIAMILAVFLLVLYSFLVA